MSEASRVIPSRPCYEKRWAVDVALDFSDAETYYYADPADQEATKSCLSHLMAGDFVMLTGPRASGKSTRLRRLVRQLVENGYLCFYVRFKSLHYRRDFWESFGHSLERNYRGMKVPMKSAMNFLQAFSRSKWEQKTKIVLFLDEFDELFHASDELRSEILRTIRCIRNARPEFAIHSLVTCGTFNLLNLSAHHSSIAPFNVCNFIIQNTYFTMLQTSQLLLDFARTRKLVIDPAVINDIWYQSNGHPGIVCLCGRVISKMAHTPTISLANWLDFVTSDLYTSYTYTTFRPMVQSLLEESASPAVSFFRSWFSGFPDLVSLGHPEQQNLADFLTSEGVLSRPELSRNEYQISAPLIDGLLRRYVIPRKFPGAPTNPPIRQAGQFSVLNILIESIKCFDKDLLRQAATWSSYKLSKVKVGGESRARVPRESVYDTELMRILTNWLGKEEAYMITGQWHLRTTQNGPRYSDIVLKKPQEQTVVLELLATGDADDVRAHIERTPRYKDLHRADQVWVVHFTCEDGYLDHAIWQSDDELENGVNVVHFYHPLDVSDMLVAARWKNDDGEVQDNTQPRSLLDAKWVDGG